MRDPVPLLEHCRVLQAEVRREIDDLHAGAGEFARLSHGDAVRRGEEHDVAGMQIGCSGVAEGKPIPAAQARKHVGDLGAGLLARGDGAHVGFRMLRQEAKQLDAGVACAADDADLDHAVLVRIALGDSILAPGVRCTLPTPGRRAVPMCAVRDSTPRNAKAAPEAAVAEEARRTPTLSASRIACACAPCAGPLSSVPLPARRASRGRLLTARASAQRRSRSAHA